MNETFDPTKEYRSEFISVLKQNKLYYNSELVKYTTPSGKHTVNYYKWNHPYQGSWEYEEIFTDVILDFVKQTIKSGDVVLDIGAQAGLMSVLYAQSAGKVISFEPNPAVHEVLELNSTIYKNIVPYNLACSREEGPLEFHYSDQGFCNGGFATECSRGIGVTGHTVPMDVYAINLDKFLNQYHSDDIKKISLIKIDAEGHDKEILKTLGNIINKTKPILITEMYAGLVKEEIVDLLNTIKGYSYEIYNITKNNSGLGLISNRKKIETINDVNVGELCNFMCLPK